MTPDPKQPESCSCAKCNPTAWWMIVCPTCGNKRCPHASDHEFICTGNNDINQTPTRNEVKPCSENEYERQLIHKFNKREEGDRLFATPTVILSDVSPSNSPDSVKVEPESGDGFDGLLGKLVHYSSQASNSESSHSLKQSRIYWDKFDKTIETLRTAIASQSAEIEQLRKEMELMVKLAKDIARERDNSIRGQTALTLANEQLVKDKERLIDALNKIATGKTCCDSF